MNARRSVIFIIVICMAAGIGLFLLTMRQESPQGPKLQPPKEPDVEPTPDVQERPALTSSFNRRMKPVTPVAGYDVLITGICKDKEGNPIPRAELLFECRQGASTTTTDDSGRFGTMVPSCPWYTLTVRARGYVPASFQVPDHARNLEILLEGGCTAAGRAVWKDDPTEPVYTYHLSIVPLSVPHPGRSPIPVPGQVGPQAYRLQAPSRTYPVELQVGEGEFEVQGLQPGLYSMEATRNDASASATVALERGQARTVTLVFEGRGGLSAVVTDAETGEPVPGAVITMSSGGFNKVFRSGPSGQVYAQAPVGSYRLVVKKKGYRFLVKLDVKVDRGSVHDLGTIELEPVEEGRQRSRYKIEYSGIGASIISRGERIFVSRVSPGSPAEDEGLQVGDRIVSVDGRDVSKMPAATVASLIRGEQGTVVVLEIDRKGRRTRLYIVRDDIEG